MRAAVLYAVLPLALIAAAFLSVVSPSAGAAPPTDITGAYEGKLAYKFYPLTEADTPGHGRFASTMSVTFSSSMVTAMLTVQGTEGPEVYNLNGRYGLGHFWVSGNGPSGQMSLTGTVAGAAGKLKIVASGAVVSVDTVNALKLTLKEQPPL